MYPIETFKVIFNHYNSIYSRTCYWLLQAFGLSTPTTEAAKEREKKKFSNMRCPYKRRNEKKTWLCKENFATNVYGDTMFLM